MVSINKLGCTKLQLNSWREINLLSYRKPAHFQELNLSSHCAAHLGLETKHSLGSLRAVSINLDVVSHRACLNFSHLEEDLA